MSNSVKLKNDNYLDSSSIVHNKTKLSEILMELIEDSGWKVLDSTYNISYRKFGKIVEVVVSLENAKGITFSASENKICATLPTGFRPSKNFFSPVYAKTNSGTNTAQLRIAIGDGGEIGLFNWGSAVTITNIYANLTFII